MRQPAARQRINLVDPLVVTRNIPANRHSLLMHWRDDAIGFSREEAVQVELARTVLDLADPSPTRPDAGERE